MPRFLTNLRNFFRFVTTPKPQDPVSTARFAAPPTPTALVPNDVVLGKRRRDETPVQINRENPNKHVKNNLGQPMKKTTVHTVSLTSFSSGLGKRPSASNDESADVPVPSVESSREAQKRLKNNVGQPLATTEASTLSSSSTSVAAASSSAPASGLASTSAPAPTSASTSAPTSAPAPAPADPNEVPQTPSGQEPPDASTDSERQHQLDLENRRAKHEKLKEEGWTDREIEIYTELDLRGHKPLFPMSWNNSLQDLDARWFTEDAEEVAIDNIDTSIGGEARATRAIDGILSVGSMVKDRMSIRHPYTEKCVERKIKDYLKWTLKDAGLYNKKPYIPNVAIASLPVSHPHSHLGTTLLRKMIKLRKNWESALPTSHHDKIPEVHGIALYGQLMGFVTLKAVDGEEDPEKELMREGWKMRVLQTFDWGLGGQNVYNAFAVPVLLIFARDELLEKLGALDGVKGVDLKAGILRVVGQRPGRGCRVDGVEYGDDLDA